MRTRCAGPASCPSQLADDFNDDDFTSNPEWAEFNPDDAPGIVSVVDGELRIFRDAPSGNGGGVGIAKNVDISVTDQTTVRFDGKPVFRNVVNGCGFDCVEHPVEIQMTLQIAGGQSVFLLYGLNYGGAVASRDWPNQRLRTTNVVQGEWARDVIFRIHDIWPEAEKITQVQLIGSGWDFEGFIDNFSISEGN